MAYNAFSVKSASLYTEKKPGGIGAKLVKAGVRQDRRVGGWETAGVPVASDVQALDFALPNCVTVRVGVPGGGSSDGLAVQIDIERSVALGLSDWMLLRPQADRIPWRRDEFAVRSLQAWTGKGAPLADVADVAMAFSSDPVNDTWTASLERIGAAREISLNVQINFDNANARLLAELLRAMPFR